MLIKDLFVWFREQIFTYNLFIPIEIDSENENEQIQQTNSNIKYQRYATRLYVPLFIIIFYIISLIMLVSPRSRLITISGMTPAKFNELRKNHGESLSCPCSSTTMIYKEFLSNSISFHPVCTSIFVTEQWIEGVYFENASAYLMMDFRSTASSQFALLSTLCKYCQKIINEVEIDLENEIFLTNDLYSEDEVQSQILKDVELIRLSTPIRSILSLLFLQTITQSNSFISALNTNAVVYIYYLQNRSIVSAGFTTYQNPKSPELSYLISTCQSINVTVPSGIYNVSYEQTADYRAFWPAFQPFFNPKPIVLINGFFSGCTPLDALLMSSLDCLFNQTCLDYLPIYFPKLNQINSSLINGLCHSKQEKISLKENLNNLLIEEWITNINYSIYFEKCSPLKCFYTETNRMNYSYAITFLFSLYGGLVIILRLISMVLIKILFQLKIYQVNLQFNRNIIMRNIHKIIQWMKQLNIFPSVQQKTPNDIKEQRLATKIYLLLLSGSFLILLLFTSLNSEMLTIYKMNPTLNEYKIFENLNLNSLQCPCTNMTISYSIFNSFNPILHDVCSSDFVGSDWISMMKLLETLPEGIQWYGINAQQIRLLANLCEKANKTIADATNRFNHRLLFTLNALSEENFNILMNTTIQQLIQSLIFNFNLFINISLLFTQIDQPFTKPIDDYFTINYTINQQLPKLTIVMNSLTSDDNNQTRECICATNPSCTNEFSINGWKWYKYSGYKDQRSSLGTIRGMEEGCFTINSLLLSSFECFYSNSCLSAVYSYMNSSYILKDTGITWISLSSLVYNSKMSHFPPNTTFSKIIQQMFVEQWNPIYSFDRYYNTCLPSYCTYSQMARTKNSIQVLIAIVSSIAGLTVVSRFITSIIMKIISKIFRPKAQRQIQAHLKLWIQIKNIVKNAIETIYNGIINLNMFPEEQFGKKFNQNQNYRFGQIATRLYLVILIIALIILIIYIIIQPQVLTKMIEKPSIEVFTKLFIKYNNTLQCPCSSISSMYKRYVTIQPTFHQICSSEFSSNDWRIKMTLNLSSDVSIYNKRDYRRYFSSHLQFLHGLCDLSIETVNDSIEQFLSSLYITTQLQPPITFQTHIDSFVKQSQSSASIIVENFINLLRYVNHGNAIISTYESNYHYYPPKWYNSSLYSGFMALSSLALSEAMIYDDGCSCGLVLNCTSQAKFFEENSSKNIWIKGLKIGCLPTEAFLSSTLECFYDQLCIELIQKQVNYMNETLISLTNSTRFLHNTLIIDLVNELFIETWSTIVNYSIYFDYCSPLYCSYTYIQQLNSFYTITLLLGLHRGLSLILKWICPKLLYFLIKIYFLRKKRSNFVHSLRRNDISTTDFSHSTFKSSKITQIPSYSDVASISPTTEQKTFSFNLLRFLCISLMIILFISIAVIPPILYLQHQQDNNPLIKATTQIDEQISQSNSNQTNPYSNPTTTISSVSPCDISFELKYSYETGNSAWPKSLVSDDFNHDGYEDVAVVNYYSNNFGIFFGNGNGSLTHPIFYSTGLTSGPNLIACADLNNDNQNDLIVNNNYNYSVGIFFGNQNGTFQQQKQLLIEQIDLFALGDFNNDAHVDFAMINKTQVNVLLGNGDGTYQKEISSLFRINCSVSSAITNDFNHDHQLDLVLLCLQENILLILFGSNNGSFYSTSVLSNERNSRGFAILAKDFNADDLPDLVVVNSLTYDIGIFISKSNGTFEEVVFYSTGDSSRPTALVINDFNNDDYFDIAVANRNSHSIGIFLGIGDGTFMEQKEVFLNDEILPFAIHSTDLNNDGKMDLIIADMSSSILQVLINNCSAQI
ncbi:unnamed protein product [Adineta ricciae]|uniref:Uncharacterized protein n=2 Tax=Adineta ricciae TaxID=249248 RepID=A0A813YAU6_ADIRI|nr:unnamed protein product [Adineta ricciae]